MQFIVIAITTFLAALSLPAHAEDTIYKDTGSEGEAVFSDVPTPGSTEVELPEGNIANPVTPRPRPDAGGSEASPGKAGTTGAGGGYRVGGNDPMEDIMRAKQQDNKGGRKQDVGNREHELSDADESYNPSEADEQYNPSKADEQYNPSEAGQDREPRAPAQHHGGGRGR